MGEKQKNPERRSEPRMFTGVFVCTHPLITMGALREKRALRANEEPMFAVRDVPVICDDQGWQEFDEILHGLLSKDEAELLDLEHMKSFDRGPFESLTDKLEPGQIHRVTDEEYRDAYSRKFGQAIFIPTYW